ncbi:hypothetical protein [Pseudomonas fluorescens]|uniref:hypothetical protein n=1 Tax=Pseudomonas fluorescens TaxID=294 RepID=UPI00123F58A7|nr:hypothetical protein [Pseudomonas fluorescens]
MQLIGYFNDMQAVTADLFMQNATKAYCGLAICKIHGGKIVTTLTQYLPTPHTRKATPRVL